MVLCHVYNLRDDVLEILWQEGHVANDTYTQAILLDHVSASKKLTNSVTR